MIGRDNVDSNKLNLIQTYTTHNPVARSSHNPIVLKADSGASRHYIKPTDQHILQDITECTLAKVTLPNKTTLQASQQGMLPINTPSPAKTALILPQLTNSSLLSIGQLCDEECIAVFDKQAVNIYKNATIILQGTRNPSDGLWDISLPNTTTKNNFIPKDNLHLNAIVEKS